MKHLTSSNEKTFKDCEIFDTLVLSSKSAAKAKQRKFRSNDLNSKPTENFKIASILNKNAEGVGS